MGDMGDDFRAMKQHSKEKRASNTVTSTEILTQSSVEFESKNSGAHLIVVGAKGKIDFWPSTGKWAARSGNYGRGIKSLLSSILNGSI
jgi:hypothetical protein